MSGNGQVFEKWAEDESRARLLNYLKNDGFIDARVTSEITTAGVNKNIVFTAQKNRAATGWERSRCMATGRSAARRSGRSSSPAI